jgi:hypothetical protein
LFQGRVCLLQLRDKVLSLALEGLDLRGRVCMGFGETLGQEEDLLLQEASILLHLGGLLKGLALQTLHFLLTFLQLRLELLHVFLLISLEESKLLSEIRNLLFLAVSQDLVLVFENLKTSLQLRFLSLDSTQLLLEPVSFDSVFLFCLTHHLLQFLPRLFSHRVRRSKLLLERGSEASVDGH